MKATAQHALLLLGCLLAPLVLSGCTSDVTNDSAEEEQINTTEGGDNQQNTGSGTNDFTLSLGSSVVNITEGQGQVDIPITVSRANGHQGDIILAISAASEADAAYLTSQFTDTTLSTGEQNANLQLDLAIGSRPIQPQTRILSVTATDSAGQVSSSQISLQVQPTSAPDVYLLVGQSNMVGISEEQARRSAAGQPDAPVSTIRQLNVTFNDEDNFAVPADFTNPAKLFNSGSALTVALDPLHSGLEGNGDKSGSRIGMGLSFAKRAQQDTTAEIFLVPAAWSDTGFCKRDTNRLPGIGWNATARTDAAFSGTLLYDRALVRTNSALDLTGGVLRGILWHQGEADSDDAVCAQAYAANLTELAQSLRTNIAVDARGPVARGPDADIPFIVGTMAVGGEQAPFSDTKMTVDAAHRNVAAVIPFSDFVNNDDLVPPAYACGGGTCIHFGAGALREMGARYYERLTSVLP